MIKEAGINQKELAEKIGVTEVTMGRWITGKREPSLFYIALICKMLGYNLDWLIYGRGDKFTRHDSHHSIPATFAGEPSVYTSPARPVTVQEPQQNLYAQFADLLKEFKGLTEPQQEQLLQIIQLQIELLKSRNK